MSGIIKFCWKQSVTAKFKFSKSNNPSSLWPQLLGEL
jgi:hypothetical protein